VTPEVRRLRPAEALLRLVELARPPYMPGAPGAEAFGRLSRLARSVPVLEVRYARCYETLPALVEAIAGTAASAA
jgi:hypothetical protein